MKTYSVTFWRGNPQLANGGYETSRIMKAKTENGLRNQIKKIENAPGYGSMTYLNHKEIEA